MKPLIVLPPDLMSPEDKKQLNDNGFCVVEAPAEYAGDAEHHCAAGEPS